MNTREEIVQAGQRWFDQQDPEIFVPGESYVRPAGRVMDSADLGLLLDASLDMWLTSGRYAERFERELAKKLGARQALLTNSGSSANLLAFSALTSPSLGDDRVAPGSEVITVAAAFPTTVAPIVQNRCVPVFVDVDSETHNIDAQYLEEALSSKTRAIMIAHTLGNPFDLGVVSDFAKKHGLYLIEDCCDAFGSTYRGRQVGSDSNLR